MPVAVSTDLVQTSDWRLDRLGSYLAFMARANRRSDKILAFLREHAPKRFCVVCVALKLGGSTIPMSEQREQLMRLADTGKVLVRLARCENCKRITEVFDICRN